MLRQPAQYNRSERSMLRTAERTLRLTMLAAVEGAPAGADFAGQLDVEAAVGTADNMQSNLELWLQELHPALLLEDLQVVDIPDWQQAYMEDELQSGQ